MRAYLHYCSTQWPTDWRIHKRWVIFRHYIRYLTRAYQKGVYVPASAQDEYMASPTKSVFSDAGETTLFERSSAALEETIQLINQFRILLATFAPLLIQTNPTDLHHRTLELTNLLVSAHETVGWGPIEYVQRTLKYFVRTRKFTFNSLCTTRHILYTLIRTGETTEAKLALTLYLELLGVPDWIHTYQHQGNNIEDLIDMIRSRLDWINEQSSHSAAENLRGLETKLNTLTKEVQNKKTPTGSCENDTEFDVVRVLLLATQHLYKQHGKEATILSDLAVALLDELDHLKKKKASQWRSLMVQAKRLSGTSYAVFATQSQDEEKRSEYLSESLLSLKRATELDPRSWQAFYELGLQQAVIGDLSLAAQSVKRSIKLRGDFIPSWHLLSLIQSSRQFHALPKSLQLIQAGLVYHLNMIENIDNEDIQDNLSLDTEEGQEFFDRAEAYMKIRMSQITMLEKLEGPEAVLKVYPDLFEMFGTLSKKMNLNRLLLVVERSSISKPTTTNSIRSRSRANSSVHSINSTLLEDNESLDSGFALPAAANEIQLDESRLFTLNKAGSRSTSRIESRSLNKVQEDEEELEEEDFVPEKPKKKKRASVNLSQLMDDPLLSFPTKKKERKEKKDKTNKRSTFLGIKRNESVRKG